MLLGAVLVVLAAAWLGVRAIQVERNLHDARAALTSIEGQLRDGRRLPPGLVAQAAAHTRTARGAARDPVWVLAAHLPFIGSTFRTTAGIAEIGDRITHESLPTLDRVSASLQTVRDADATHDLPIDALRAAAGGLRQVDAELDADRFALEHLSSTPVTPIAHARTLLLDQLRRAADQVHAAAVGATLGVPMLGGDGPRDYFIAFENPAEARPDMGLLAGFAELTANHGRLHTIWVGGSGQLPPPILPSGSASPELTQGYFALGAGRNWSSSNLSPDFAQNAALWSAMYATSTRRPIDGAIALDPVAIGQILARSAVNLTLPGLAPVPAADVPRFLESTEYALPMTESVRKDLLARAGRQAVDALLAGHTSTITLLRTLGALADTGHLRLYSNVPAEQAQIAAFPIAGVLPTTSRPFVGAYVTNAAANKLDYYLDEKVSWTADTCSSETQRATVTVALTNNVPARHVPTFVTENHVEAGPRLPNGTHKVLVSLVLAPGSTATGATVAGKPVSWALESVERGGHPLFMLTVVLPPRVTTPVTVSVTEPRVHGAPMLATQPLPRKPVTRVEGKTC